MPSNKQLFLQHIGQTSPFPLAVEMAHADGIYMYDTNDKAYIDLISGVSVSNLGHHHPQIIAAIKAQVDKYMHLMVYGELIQSPQLQFAELLSQQLPDQLNSIYLVNSGSEAIEVAMKLAKRITGRSKIISCQNAYHGSTQGAMSIMGSERYKTAFRPLLPDIQLIEFNNFEDIQQIDHETACIIIEPIQGEAGIISPQKGYLQAIENQCKETGTLFILDEIQTGFGRSGHLFAFQKYEVNPDVICIAKAMGGGMPIGGVVSSTKNLNAFTNNPMLGHITTFGGHPVSAAAAYAHLKILVEQPEMIQNAEYKATLFKQRLENHPKVKAIRYDGFYMAVDLGQSDLVLRFLQQALQNGILSDLFLFNEQCFRISPPLTMTEAEIEKAASILLMTLDQID
jgi:acetylornithine/succinyldiaminopimelate/putrescine aminotransferase